MSTSPSPPPTPSRGLGPRPDIRTDEPGPRRAEAVLDVGALRRNLQAFRRIVGPERPVLGVCKADAYGHGAVPVARGLREAGCERLGVASADEGAELRGAGIAGPVHVLGPLASDEVEAALARDLVPAVGSFAEAADVARAARRLDRPARVHLALDLGMARHGVAPAEAADVARRIADLPGTRLAGLMGHLPCPTDPDVTRSQATAYVGARDAVERTVGRRLLGHLAASSAACRHPFVRADLCRSGAFLLGFDPDGLRAEGFDPEPTLALRAPVVSVRDLAPGEPVSYGGRWTADRPTRLATVAAGYADGVPLGLTNRGAFLLHGREAPVRGRVTMDYVMVDVTDIPEVAPGDEATVFGPDGEGRVHPIERVAAEADLIPYAVATGLGPRVHRRVEGRVAREPRRKAAAG